VGDSVGRVDRFVTRREFAHQASSFERAGSLFSDGDILNWIDRHAPVDSGDWLLDVAGGTGNLGRHLGRRARSTVVLDLTPEMLAAGARAAADEGREDVLYVLGDATALPFPDAQFNVVTCRFALHHMAEPARAVAEMARACRPDAVVVTVDMVVEDERQNEVERLRDPSHAVALTEAGMRAVHERAGLTIECAVVREQALDGERWLAQSASVDAETEAARALLEAELAGGEPTGLNPSLEAGRLTIQHRWLLLVARHP
jgi:ubiquinone/menaquinone biosynthesis C-methylase UbiE